MVRCGWVRRSSSPIPTFKTFLLRKQYNLFFRLKKPPYLFIVYLFLFNKKKLNFIFQQETLFKSSGKVILSVYMTASGYFGLITLPDNILILRIQYTNTYTHIVCIIFYLYIVFVFYIIQNSTYLQHRIHPNIFYLSFNLNFQQPLLFPIFSSYNKVELLSFFFISTVDTMAVEMSFKDRR